MLPNIALSKVAKSAQHYQHTRQNELRLAYEVDFGTKCILVTGTKITIDHHDCKW